MIVSMIAAVAENGVIGSNGELPWRVRDDMRFFMRTTAGHWVLTGRRNFDAMGLLKGRPTVVVTRTPTRALPGAHPVGSIAEGLALAKAAGESEAFIIGGSEIYALGYDFAHVFYRTRILASVAGDVLFPELDFSDWRCEVIGQGVASEHNEHAFVIEKLTRLSAPPCRP